MRIKVKKMFKLNFFLLICHFTPKTCNGGDLLPITTTNDPSVFLSNSVNDSQGLMCLKYKQFFYYKQHPTCQDDPLLSSTSTPDFKQYSINVQKIF